MEKIERLKQIYRIIREMIDENNLISVLNYMETAYNDKNIDFSTLRMIMVATKSHKNHELIKECRQNIKDLAEKMIGGKIW